MPVNLRFAPNFELAVFEYSADITMEEDIQAGKQFLGSSDFQLYNKRLDIYHTDVEVKWSFDDFFHHKSKLGELTGFLSKIRVAVVTESSFIFGVHRMYDIENKITSVYKDHKTFYTLDKACSWLNIPRDIFQVRFPNKFFSRVSAD